MNEEDKELNPEYNYQMILWKIYELIFGEGYKDNVLYHLVESWAKESGVTALFWEIGREYNRLKGLENKLKKEQNNE